MSSHTPGPWNAGTIVRIGVDDEAYEPDGEAVVYADNDDGFEINITSANAREDAALIAAGPLLLVALRNMIKRFESALEGQTNNDGVLFVQGQTDIPILEDGSYMLSDARAAILRAQVE